MLKNPALHLFLGLNVGQLEKAALDRDAAAHGLGVITAAIFLAGEMAGSGVLALPNAMAGTGNCTSFDTMKVSEFFTLRLHFIVAKKFTFDVKKFTFALKSGVFSPW